jgi:hypothetical protein
VATAAKATVAVSARTLISRTLSAALNFLYWGHLSEGEIRVRLPADCSINWDSSAESRAGTIALARSGEC